MSTSVWTDVEIAGRACSFTSFNGIRLYVSAKPGTVEAWADTTKIGNYSSIRAAQYAALRHVGIKIRHPVLAFVRPAPAPAPVLLEPVKLRQPDREIPPNDPFKFVQEALPKPVLDPRLAELPPREMIWGAPDRKPPVRVEEEAKLFRYPLADLSKPVTAIQEMVGEYRADYSPISPAEIAKEDAELTELYAVSKPTIALPGECQCGAKLGRSGKCPALCQPVTDPQPEFYTGPMTAGRTHIGRLAEPVS